MKQDKNGLNICGCLRGTNKNETSHNHFENSLITWGTGARPFLKTQQITMDLCGQPLDEWWPNSAHFINPDESFWTSPITKDADVVTSSDTKVMKPSLQFIALKQKQRVPILPVSSSKERVFFEEFLSKYSL